MFCVRRNSINSEEISFVVHTPFDLFSSPYESESPNSVVEVAGITAGNACWTRSVLVLCFWTKYIGNPIALPPSVAIDIKAVGRIDITKTT
ncbi:hypothetical protein OVS_03170 [Mycoplasma ovis str. Michigan]|uniref:Uncharacterized protein n=1 Tax=Mycoplasma ovis str. Michigan TaxID=1415773 RepID=A0ABM5P234_9MOLU|nr:hypothetical protein OVS_03170 [Mycoplasma ovis str. Michigan]